MFTIKDDIEMIYKCIAHNGFYCDILNLFYINKMKAFNWYKITICDFDGLTGYMHGHIK